MDNKVQVSPGAAGQDAAMTGVMNALGQEGEFSHKQMPIKNRVNGLDVSEISSSHNNSITSERHKRGYQNAQ